jgi:glycosyltransferase involved in cell wall biosynthesis
MTLRHVGISLGNLGAFVDGLGEFSRQLGQTLVDQAPTLRAQHGLVLHVHCRPELQGCFGPGVHYLPVQRSQEWWHRSPQRMDLWHTTSQLNRYGPPHGQGRRLVTVHDLNYLYEKSGWSRRRHQWRMRQCLARSDAIVAITEHVAGDIRRALGWGGPLRVVHNGVRDLTQGPREPVAALQGRPFFFHISRMTPNKNVEALLAMMALWPERHLVLAGPVAGRNAELQARADASGLGNVTVLTGIGDAQKAWLYAHCQAFFFPSLTEGFGLPPIEAMHFGKPTFLSTLTSLPEVGGHAAYYWTAFDPQAMRQAVEQGLAAHTAERAQAAVRRAAGFSWEAAARGYVQAYLDLLDGAPR